MIGKSSISGGTVQVFESLNGIRHLAETGRFKAWFLDQFGVLHDGKHSYPGAITTLEKLASYGAKMVIISNSSRRVSTTIEKLESLGFDTSLFFGAITSGELTHQYLQSSVKGESSVDWAEATRMELRLAGATRVASDKDADGDGSRRRRRRDDSWFATLGRSCIHMTWSDRGAISLEGLGLQVVESIEDANFILAHGTEALGLPSGDARSMKLEDLEHVLELCAEYKIPMVVANPDYVTVEARDLRAMPGMLAAKYEKLGGEVKWMGKPDERAKALRGFCF